MNHRYGLLYHVHFFYIFDKYLLQHRNERKKESMDYTKLSEQILLPSVAKKMFRATWSGMTRLRIKTADPAKVD